MKAPPPPKEPRVGRKTVEQRLNLLLKAGDTDRLERLIGYAIDRRFNIKLEMETMTIKVL